jgi:hypothetical protein
MDEVASGSPVAPEMHIRTPAPVACQVYSALSNDASDEVSARHPKVNARITVLLRAET